MIKSFRSILTDESGQGLAEYGLILGLIAVVCVAAVVFLSGRIQGLLSNVGSSI
ncbi:MAG: Flp family type IVb pilin [Candidatus Eremiobacteraeota bacterium]|nr:Flp family type IVb pilin [Candidatus Eremiobacteraeota bacterium]MBV8644307.1 Flp family type IVb pilin [Candidatus Eremiobacteraeota bacterium]MBV8748581.1 Flp family type IVb pilin [Candidatus Eremiobacteraeota bacterium]MBV9408313.1 Flp family type IVb pilin [Candidatus Eremiobacteraeota bacterium]